MASISEEARRSGQPQITNGRRNADRSRKQAKRRLADEWAVQIRNDGALSATAKFVGLVLATYMNSNGTCFPSTLTLGDNCGWQVPPGATSHRNVSKATKELERVGYLKIRRRHNASNLYEASFPRYLGGTTVRSNLGGTGSGTTVRSNSPIEVKSSNERESEEKDVEKSPLGSGWNPAPDYDIPF